MEELLSLKWNNHNTSFIEVLSNLRSKPLYTDATLACEGNLYNVHKFVLSTCSDYFRNIFESIQCKEPVIILMDIKCNELKALLDYMYLGEVNVSQMDLAPLIKTAECLQLKGLTVPDEKEDKRKLESTHSNTQKKKLKVTDHSLVESPNAEPTTESFDSRFIEKENPNEVLIMEEETECEIVDNKDEIDPFNLECNEMNLPPDITENIGPELPFEQKLDAKKIISKQYITTIKCEDELSIKEEINDEFIISGQTDNIKVLESFGELPQCTYSLEEKKWSNKVVSDTQKNSEIGGKLFSCQECSFKTGCKRKLKIHILKHSGEFPFSCEKCSYKTAYKCNLKIHILKHSRKFQFHCEECSFKTKRKDSLKKHMLRHSAD